MPHQPVTRVNWNPAAVVGSMPWVGRIPGHWQPCRCRPPGGFGSPR